MRAGGGPVFPFTQSVPVTRAAAHGVIRVRTCLSHVLARQRRCARGGGGQGGLGCFVERELFRGLPFRLPLLARP